MDSQPTSGGDARPPDQPVGEISQKALIPKPVLPGDDRLNNFDLLRLLAAAQVIVNHVNEFLKLPVEPHLAAIVSLFPGVPIFFVISGFLVTKSYVEGESMLGKFLAKRALRIYPALFLNIFLINVVLYHAGAFRIAEVFSWPFIRHHLIQLPTASWWYAGWISRTYPYNFPAYNGGQYPNLVLWTLTVELGFYLLLPVILGRLVCRKVTSHTLYSVCVWMVISTLCAIWMGWLSRVDPNSNTRAILINMIMPHLWAFLLGTTLYLFWPRVKGWVAGRFPLWLLAYCALSYYDRKANGVGILNYTYFSPMVCARLMLLAICCLSFAYTWPKLSRFLRGEDISYGLYLHHFLIIWLLGYHGITGHVWLWPLVAALAVIVAFLSWRLIERPMLRLKVRLR
jgi:peptidoglycan/LPS O-acetylase OafA/YrhL